MRMRRFMELSSSEGVKHGLCREPGLAEHPQDRFEKALGDLDAASGKVGLHARAPVDVRQGLGDGGNAVAAHHGRHVKKVHGPTGHAGLASTEAYPAAMRIRTAPASVVPRTRTVFEAGSASAAAPGIAA